MFVPLTSFGSISEVGSTIWDSATLAREVERRAAFLSSAGVGRLSRVAIIHGNSVRFFADLFAVWSVGATAVCLDGSLTASELSTIVTFVKPSAILVDREPAPTDIGVPIFKLADVSVQSAGALQQDGQLDDPALILFTSGTTGSPKGVVLSFRAILARLSLNVLAIGRPALARALVTLPTHFGHGLIGNSLTPLMSGGSIVLHPPGIQLAQSLGQVIDEQRITFISSVPTLWRMVLQLSSPPSGNSLQRVHVGSAPLSTGLWSDIADWSRADVVNCYGITETANWIAGASSRGDSFVDGLIGRPWGGTIAVRSEKGKISAAGEGEIVVQTPSLMSGYLDRPELTASVMSNGWYRTGDFGKVDEDGRARLTGRIKDEINRAGIKIQPAEIDALLERHPSIEEACVFAIDDEVSGEVVAAAVKLKKGAKESESSIRDWCRERLRRVAIPNRWFFVEEIPRNARGKVSRDAVRRALVKEASDSAGAGIATDAARGSGGRVNDFSNIRVRAAVEQAWSQALDRRSFAANQAWSDAGGDSLNALHLWFLIESELGVRLPLDALDNNATPQALIDALERFLQQGSVSAPLEHGNRNAPVVFFFPPAEGDAPIYARFRAAFDGKIRFLTIDYPPWRDMVDAGGDANAIIDAAVAQIEASAAGEPYLLCGYSFGGIMAWETAGRLAELGQQVGFVGLIDAQLISAVNPMLRSIKVFGPNGVITRAANVSLRSVLTRLVGIRAVRLLRRLDQIASLLPAKAAFNARLRLIQQIRRVALQRRNLIPRDIVATLFRSEEFAADQPDFGWSALCKRLAIVPIEGDHGSFFERPARDKLCTLFLHEVLASSPQVPGEFDLGQRNAEPRGTNAIRP